MAGKTWLCHLEDIFSASDRDKLLDGNDEDMRYPALRPCDVRSYHGIHTVVLGPFLDLLAVSATYHVRWR